ncbi:MAG TPA: hypothetical protein VF715_13245 [Thermoleophilaceae bacterium]|jgi:hypothetical protein
MEAAAVPTTRETVTDLLANTAHIFNSYPRSVEAIGALVIEHLEKDEAENGPAGAAGASPVEQAMARFRRVFDDLVADPRMKQIKVKLASEYDPPPYSELPPLPGEPAPEGEPVSFTAAVIAVGLAATAGAAIGAVIPL